MRETENHVRGELDRLIQLVVTEGTKIVTAFAATHALHPTDVETLTRVLLAQQRGAPLTAGALRAELGLTSGAVTFVVDRLVKAGHLARARDATDRRKVLLHYTPAGQELAKTFFGPLQQRNTSTMDQFSADQLEVVHRYLAVTVEAMTAHRRTLSDSTARHDHPRT